jgi:hypothetical protein
MMACFLYSVVVAASAIIAGYMAPNAMETLKQPPGWHLQIWPAWECKRGQK